MPTPTPDNPLSAKVVIGGQEKLVEWKDFLKFIPGEVLERLKEAAWAGNANE